MRADGGPPPVAEQAGRRGGAHRAPPAPARWVAVVVLLLAGAAALLLVRPWSGDGNGSPERGVATAAVDVAAWLPRQTAEGTPLTAAEDLRPALEDAGLADRLVAEGTDDALRVVDGEPPPDALVLARFEADGTALSVVDPTPARPTAAELSRRQDLAAAVLANPVAGATGRAADVLRTADVDARLLTLLAGLVSRMDVHVADFPPAPGEPADGPPARWLLIDRMRGEPLLPGGPATEQVVAFLEAQRPPLAPDHVETTDEGVLVGFGYIPAPDAVVPAGTP
jgi:hypothetical protein